MYNISGSVHVHCLCFVDCFRSWWRVYEWIGSERFEVVVLFLFLLWTLSVVVHRRCSVSIFLLSLILELLDQQSEAKCSLVLSVSILSYADEYQ